MKHLLFRTLVAIGLLMAVTSLQADSEAGPISWIATSEWGNAMFKMVAPKWGKKGDDHVVVREPFGVAYEIDEEGELKELWRTQGWHSPELFLSDEGRYLVRMGPWARDQENHTDLAVAFYDRGVLLKEYRVCDLLKDADKAEDSVSHYMWRPEEQSEATGFKREGGALLPTDKEPPLTFHLVMIDKTAYRFDVATGKVLSTTTDTGSKSRREISQATQMAEAEKGKQLYAGSSFKADYDAHFELAEVNAGGGKIMGVWFDDPEWRADLTPRKKYTLPCEVEAVFPIGQSGKIEVSITPAEVDEAFESILAHSFVKQCIADKRAANVRLRITGDRLQWDSEELRQLMGSVLSGRPVTATDLRPWAEVILSSAERKFTSFFLNVKTGQIIDEDNSKWPYEPYLLDAKGVRVDKR